MCLIGHLSGEVQEVYLSIDEIKHSKEIMTTEIWVSGHGSIKFY